MASKDTHLRPITQQPKDNTRKYPRQVEQRKHKRAATSREIENLARERGDIRLRQSIAGGERDISEMKDVERRMFQKRPGRASRDSGSLRARTALDTRLEQRDSEDAAACDDAPDAQRVLEPDACDECGGDERRAGANDVFDGQQERERVAFAPDEPFVEIECCRAVREGAAEAAEDALRDEQVPDGCAGGGEDEAGTGDDEAGQSGRAAPSGEAVGEEGGEDGERDVEDAVLGGADSAGEGGVPRQLEVRGVFVLEYACNVVSASGGTGYTNDLYRRT